MRITKGVALNRLLHATLAVTFLASARAPAQPVPPLPSHPEPLVPESIALSTSEHSEPATGSQASTTPKPPEEIARNTPQRAARGSDAAAADRKPQRLSDPTSRCAVINMWTLPVDGVAWSGRCTGGLASGQGTATFSNKGKFFESVAGNFDQGILLDGQVTMKWANGSSYEGAAVAGRMEGPGLLTSLDGDRFQGQWAGNRMNGHGTVTWANGDRYEGEWRDGKADGHGVQTWSDGRTYDGEWHNDLPNGHGVVTREDGNPYEGTFVDGHPADVNDMAVKTSAAAATTADAVPAKNATIINASETTAASAQDTTNGGPAARWSSFDDFADKKLSAVDGSTLALSLTEGGLTREIVAPDGAVKKTLFVFLNDRLGSVYEGSDSSVAAGVFRVTDMGITIYYADGRSETLTVNGAGGLSTMLNAPASDAACMVWYPQGHRFSAGEREAALAEYANRLGLKKPRHKTHGPSVKSDCDAASGSIGNVQVHPRVSSVVYNPQAAIKFGPVPRANAQAATSRSHAHRKSAAPAAGVAGLVVQPSYNTPVVVPTSTVHLIDADTPMPDAGTLASNENSPSAGGGDKASASSCLTVESDGRHWGFRNHCEFDVQFAYCLANASDPLTSCREAAVSGSVAANGFGALIADQSLKESDAHHDFRWVACSGGAGEVVVHLDRSDPPVGRCVRPGAS